MDELHALREKFRTEDLRETVRELEARVERQTLVLRALFTLLMETTGLTEDDLLERVKLLAPLAGVYARQTPPRRPCAKCGSSMGQRRNRCLFCGEEWQVASAFEYLDMDVGTPPTAEPREPSSEAIRPARMQDL